jgi:hypothetical protein
VKKYEKYGRNPWLSMKAGSGRHFMFSPFSFYKAKTQNNFI